MICISHTRIVCACLLLYVMHIDLKVCIFLEGKKKKNTRVIVSGSPSFDLASRIFCLALCLAAGGNWEA